MRSRYLWVVCSLALLGCGDDGADAPASQDASADGSLTDGPLADGSLNVDASWADGSSGDAADLDAGANDSSSPSDTGADGPVFTGLFAFPSAVGWGKDATGGRGGEVRKVTNLHNSGAGSLRAAWEASGKATIVFEVAGTITVSSPIKPTGDKTVAGETAFRNGGHGITIRRDGKYGDSAVSGNMNNSIIRFMRFRPGPGSAPECCGDAVTILSGQNIIFDHCSFSWSTDEIFNAWGAVKRVTMQNSIFSSPLAFASHTYTTDPNHASYKTDHSKAWLSGGSNTDASKSASHFSLYNTIFAHSKDRNPAIGGAAPEFELVNTLLYNWGSFGSNAGSFGTKAINIINHYAINGTNTSSQRYPIAAQSNAKLFVAGIFNAKKTSDDWSGVGCETGCGAGYMTQPAPVAWRAASPFNYPLKNEPVLTAAQIKSKVLANAGANLFVDGTDQQLFTDINSGTGSLIDNPSEVGGWPSLANLSSVPLDTDGDGMPDAYEAAQGLNKNSAADGAADSGDGYTHLEKYLFTLTGGT